MRKRLLIGGAGLAAVLSLSVAARSHFQVLRPSADIVETGGSGKVEFDIVFTHPMTGGPVMETARPKAFGVLVAGRKTDLTSTLRARKVEGKTAYTSSYRIARPGAHVFHLEPAPYWEPAERKMIVHYTKVVVGALGDEAGWDAMVGMPVEIEPLVRPFGLWTGNVFRGVVRVNGKPAPFAEIEVEYYNEGGKVAPPSDPFVTQVIKADVNGTFCYAIPRAGWWAFAALVESDKKMANPDGEMVEAELGGLIWVKAVDMK